MAINLFVASGNIGKDIDVRFTPNGKCIGSFSLPVKSGWGDNEKTSWIRCKVFGDRAEKLQPYLVKGVLVTVSGRFEMEEWEKDGVTHSMPVMIVNEIVLPPKDTSRIYPPRQQAVESKPLTQEQLNDLDDSIPF